MKYSIIDYFHHILHNIQKPYLFYDWKFVFLDPPHPFCSPLKPLPSNNNQSNLCIFEHLFFKFHISEIMIFVSLWLTSLSIIPMRSTHVTYNKISFFCVCGCLFKFSAYFKNWIGGFLSFNCMSYLYILDINPLLDI